MNNETPARIMHTSTPEVRGIARRSLVLPPPNATPLRRSIAQPVVLLEELPDDEIERSARRSLVDTHRRVSNIPAQTSLNESTQFSGEQEIKDHFQICSKLYADGKISARNAWDLHIIDIIKHVSKKGGPNSLQVAGTSLDIGAKVYGIRVDDVYADSMKLAGSLTKSTKEVANEDGNEDALDNEANETAHDNERVTKKKRKKKTFRIGDKATIAKDVSTLSGALPKLESVYFSSRIRSDATAVDNLASNQMRMDKAGYKLFNDQAAWTSDTDHEARVETKYTLSFKPLGKSKICDIFEDIHIDEWDPDEDAREFSRQQRQEEMLLDENGIPIPELDGSIHDIFENQDNDAIDEPMMEVDDEEHVAPLLRREVEHIVELTPAETGGRRSEYAYNLPFGVNENKRIIEQIWAGPSHWKLKYLRRSKVQFSGTESQVTTEKPIKQGRRKLPVPKISFDVLNDFDVNLKLKNKRKPSTTDRLKTLLPIPDFSFLKVAETIRELSLKPGVCPQPRTSVDGEGAPVDVANYRYDNLNDSQYCSQQAENNDDGDVLSDCGNGEYETQAVMAHQNCLGDNLVEAPEAVPKMNIFYALQPKKVDMKKLKMAEWQILTGKPSTEIQKGEHYEVIPTIFSELFKKVPALLPEKMRKELTSPIVFQALLFLCNEHNLELIQYPDCSDCGIIGPSPNPENKSVLEA